MTIADSFDVSPPRAGDDLRPMDPWGVSGRAVALRATRDGRMFLRDDGPEPL